MTSKTDFTTDKPAAAPVGDPAARQATQTNLKWLSHYGVRPIVQTRSLFDVLPVAPSSF
jgi:hypothetical protein